MIEPQREERPQHDRPKRFRRMAAVAAVCAPVVIAVAAFLAYTLLVGAGHGNPDPGGRRLVALSSVAVAVPTGAQVLVRTLSEPRWDSCDGRKGTFGWDDVVVAYEFRTAQPPDDLLSRAAGKLMGQGWVVARSSGEGGAYLTGSRTLGVGVPLKVILSADYATIGGPIADWDLYASAPPLGRPSSGC